MSKRKDVRGMEDKWNDEICPWCHEKVEWTKEESGSSSEHYIIGSFCENCKRWVLTTSCWKLRRDNTTYQIRLLENKSLKKEQRDCIRRVTNQSEDGISQLLETITPIIFQGNATEVDQKIRLLKEAKINYEIVPPFPFEMIEVEKTQDNTMELLDENDIIDLDKRQYNLIMKDHSFKIQQIIAILKYSNKLFVDNVEFNKKKEGIIVQGDALTILENAYWLDRNKIKYDIVPEFPYHNLLKNIKEVAEKNEKLEKIFEGEAYDWKKIYDNSIILNILSDNT